MFESSPLIAILIVVCVAYKIIKAFFKFITRGNSGVKVNSEYYKRKKREAEEEYKKSCEELKKCFTKRFWTDPNYF